MNSILPALFFFILFVFLFFREGYCEHKRFLEADRLDDEHILRDIERFKREKAGLPKQFH